MDLKTIREEKGILFDIYKKPTQATSAYRERDPQCRKIRKGKEYIIDTEVKRCFQLLVGMALISETLRGAGPDILR